jgi:SAM-dependent methyltransferase
MVSGSAVLRVDPSNAEQAKAWDGDEGAYWATHPDRFDRSLAAYDGRFLDTAEIRVADRVLDIGCGTGQNTRDAARRANAGEAVGVDLSSRMIQLARGRAEAEGVANVSFERADAQIHPFAAGSFDVALSRTGAMFFGDPVAAFSNIAGALRLGGRLALLTWQPPPGNEWIREFSTAMAAGRDMPTPPPDAPGPFSLSDPDRVRGILTAAGFDHIRCEAISEGMWFGSTADDAYEFVLGLLGWMLQGLDDAGRAQALEALRSTMAAHETADGVVFSSAAWLITGGRV